MRISLVPFLLAGLLAVPLRAQRQVLPLDSGWTFIRRDVGPEAMPDQTWRPVSLPHTWNIQDLPDPLAPEGKYRGAGWYHRDLALPPQAQDKRVFVRFEAAGTVSDVFLDGRHVGQHRGAFGAFCYELTPFLKGRDTGSLRVRVDNSFFQDVAPWKGTSRSTAASIARPASSSRIRSASRPSTMPPVACISPSSISRTPRPWWRRGR